ncbi:PR-1-like protein [Aureobasidium sp. EXF-12298]|nr:PR-1-like protein [Aureobasidium sp. EXF-12298]
MRTSTLFAGAALAATAFAGPMFKRDLEIDTVYDVAYETVYVTETEGTTIPVTVPAPAPTQYSTPAEQAAPAVTVVTSEAPVATVVSSATSAPAAASTSAEPKAAIPAQGYTSAWTSYWTVTPSAKPTTVVATSSAAPAATSEVSLLESFHHLLSRDSLHPRVNFESLMAQMFRPASPSSHQSKRATSTIKSTFTVKASTSTKKITVTSKKATSTSKTTITSKKVTSSSKKATSTSKKLSSSSKKVSTTAKGSPISTKAPTTSLKTSSTKKVSSLLSTVERVASVPASRNACKRESSVAFPYSSYKSLTMSTSSSSSSPRPTSSSKPCSTSVKVTSTSSHSSSTALPTSKSSSSQPKISSKSSSSSLKRSSSSTLISNAKTTSQASSTIAAPAGKATTYQERVVDHHNVHRANHSAPALEWDSQLAATAAKIAATCVYAHSMDVDGGNYGQNIAAGVEANNVSAVITELFYNGEVGYYTNLYGQANPDMTNFEKWGHFSQLVWKGTTKVGCATQYCSGGLANVGQYVSPHFTVCNYGAPGNYAGEYADNIGASLNQPTQDWQYNL